MKFSPLDLNEYDGRLVCTIPNLEEGKTGPVISIKGKSVLPYCHFELTDSDYLSSARRNPEMRGPRGAPPGTTLDPNTRVIEFKSIGVGVKTTKRFSILNPTVDSYSYQWVNDDDPDPKIVPSFSCLTAKGVVKTGKKQEVCIMASKTDVSSLGFLYCVNTPNTRENCNMEPIISSMHRNAVSCMEFVLGA